jgi:aryl sulfotransferase
MKILQAGYPKSGNYWLYRILTEIKSEAGIEQESFIKKDPIYPIAKDWELSYKEQIDIDMIDILYQGCFYRISSRYRSKIDDLNSYVQNTNHVWTHSNFCETSNDVFAHFDKIIYLIRDPRDVAVSSANFAFTPYMQKYYPTWYSNSEQFLKEELSNICKTWAIHVAEYLESGAKIHYVFYERLLFDFDNELGSLLDYLGVSLTDDQKKHIKSRVSFTMMRESNPSHVNKVRLYGWKFKLNGWQKNDCLRNIKPLLEYLNYPLNIDDENMPGFVSSIKPEAISTIKRQLTKKTLNQRLKLFQQALK